MVWGLGVVEGRARRFALAPPPPAQRVRRAVSTAPHHSGLWSRQVEGCR